LRILHVDTARTWRGGQNQVLLTVLGQRRAGHDVTLACRRGGALERRAQIAGVATEALPFRGDVSPRATARLALLLRRLRPEVVQLHDPHGVSAARFARAAVRVPLVATRRVDFPLRSALSRWKYRGCARVVAVSRAIAGVLERGGLSESVVRVVYEGVPDRPAQPGGREALAALGIPPGARVVGNVAALVDHKDHRTLLAAAARVIAERSDAYFVIVGEGELRTALEEQAESLRLGGRLIFTGFRTDLDRLVPAFDVFCLSSHMEGLGTSVLDAMCFARPVVATAAGGIPEAVEDGVTGRVVRPRDAEALGDAILEVLGDPARAGALGRAGRVRFETRFTTDRMIEQTLAVYAEVV
jgi:glycosyltransferase involved in cell wall biosynthesis